MTIRSTETNYKLEPILVPGIFKRTKGDKELQSNSANIPGDKLNFNTEPFLNFAIKSSAQFQHIEPSTDNNLISNTAAVKRQRFFCLLLTVTFGFH